MWAPTAVKGVLRVGFINFLSMSFLCPSIDHKKCPSIDHKKLRATMYDTGHLKKKLFSKSFCYETSTSLGLGLTISQFLFAIEGCFMDLVVE